MRVAHLDALQLSSHPCRTPAGRLSPSHPRQPPAGSGTSERENIRCRDVLSRWEPEDQKFWRNTGARMANGNLWICIPALALAFNISMLWSVVVVNLDKAGFELSKNQMFWL